MEFTDYNKIARIIESEVGKDSILSIDNQAIQPYFNINKDFLLQICNTLKSSSELYFDFLNCITAVDNGSEINTIDLIYHISSIPFGNSCILKVEIDRTLDVKIAPTVESISSIWKTADWHEREIYDFFGVQFNNHPDLRRILLPGDWEGHPMRKDYQEQEFYHDIKVKY